MKNISIKYRKSLFLILSVLVFFSMNLPVFSQTIIYQKTDTNGKKYFSDTPATDAIPFKLKATNMYSSAASVKNQSADAKEQNSEVDQHLYKKFSLIQPANQQSLYNQQEIVAMVQIEPVLQPKDNIAWWLDGKIYQQNTSTQITIHSLDRGEHTLQATLLDAKNHILLTTQMVTFYVHYATVIE